MINIGDTVEITVEDTNGFPKGHIGKVTGIDEGWCYEVDGHYEYAESELRLYPQRTRGFHRIQGFNDIPLPQRKTKFSAGYDIASSIDITLLPMVVTLIPTGLKAYMGNDEYLGLHLRSSIGINHSLMLVNGQGIIDSDYYNNPENEGHIQFPVINLGSEPVVINAGQRIGQGIFYKFLVTDDDNANGVRQGGTGSTGV